MDNEQLEGIGEMHERLIKMDETIEYIKQRIKALQEDKLEQCVCTNRKDKTKGCDHCSECMYFNDTIEELEAILERCG